MLSLLGEVVLFRGGAWGIGEIAIAIVIIAAVVALVMIACRQFGVSPPPWLIQCLWVVLVAVVVIFCIRLVMSM